MKTYFEKTCLFRIYAGIVRHILTSSLGSCLALNCTDNCEAPWFSDHPSSKEPLQRSLVLRDRNSSFLVPFPAVSHSQSICSRVKNRTRSSTKMSVFKYFYPELIVSSPWYQASAGSPQCSATRMIPILRPLSHIWHVLLLLMKNVLTCLLAAGNDRAHPS